MMIHYDNENTNIEQQGDHKPHTEYLRHSLSPWGNIKMIHAHAGWTKVFSQVEVVLVNRETLNVSCLF